MQIFPLPVKQALVLAILTIEQEADNETPGTVMHKELLAAVMTLREMLKNPPHLPNLPQRKVPPQTRPKKPPPVRSGRRGPRLPVVGHSG